MYDKFVIRRVRTLFTKTTQNESLSNKGHSIINIIYIYIYIYIYIKFII